MGVKVGIIHAKNPIVGVDTAQKKKEALKKVLPELERSILHEPIEHVYFLGSSGQVMTKAEGKEDHCGFSLLCSDANEISGRGNVIITHNHPSVAKPITPTLSPPDIYTASFINAREIRAVSEDTEKVYSLVRPEDGWPEIKDKADFQKVVDCFFEAINAPYFAPLDQEERADAVAAVLYNTLGYDIITLEIGELNEGI